jgi:hypothetical protein
MVVVLIEDTIGMPELPVLRESNSKSLSSYAWCIFRE